MIFLSRWLLIRSIWLKDEILTTITNPVVQSGPGNNNNEKLYHAIKSSLVSYQGHWFGGFNSLQRCRRRIVQVQGTRKFLDTNLFANLVWVALDAFSYGALPWIWIALCTFQLASCCTYSCSWLCFFILYALPWERVVWDILAVTIGQIPLGHFYMARVLYFSYGDFNCCVFPLLM